MITVLLNVWRFRSLLLGLLGIKRLLTISQYFSCNSCSSRHSAFSRIWALALALASFSCILRLCASFPTYWRFSKKASCASSSASFTFPTIMSDLKLHALFDFELLLEDLLEWLFFLNGAFEHLNIYHAHLFPSAKNVPSSWSWKSFHLLHRAFHHYCWFALTSFHILLVLPMCCYN